MVKIYSTSWCPSCIYAKRFLTERGVEFEEINIEEKGSMNVLLRGAAVRILVTRLHDKIFHPDDALVKLKDPKE